MALRNHFQDVEKEHVAGGAAAAWPLGVMATQGLNPNLSKVKNLTASQMYGLARAGDILLTRGKEPYSGFRLGVPPLTGSPYYHAEQIWTGKNGRKLHGIAGDQAGYGLTPYIKEQESVMLMRPKNFPRGRETQLREAVEKILKDSYSYPKVVGAGAAGALMPQAKWIGKMPAICKGDVCSTTPASAMRAIGIDPKLRSLPGFELSGDYLRSDNWKPMATYGVKPSPYHQLVSTLPARSLMAGAMGGAAYTATKDFREGEGAAPVAAAAGGVGGGALGYKADAFFQSVAEEEDRLARQWGKRVERFPGIGKDRAKQLGARVAAELAGMHHRMPLIPTAIGALVGALGAYGVAKLAYRIKEKLTAKENIERRGPAI